MATQRFPRARRGPKCRIRKDSYVFFAKMGRRPPHARITRITKDYTGFSSILRRKGIPCARREPKCRICKDLYVFSRKLAGARRTPESQESQGITRFCCEGTRRRFAWKRWKGIWDSYYKALVGIHAAHIPCFSGGMHLGQLL